MLPEIAPWPALAAGLLLAFGGLAALSQGMERHRAQVWDAPPLRASQWRAAGAACLFAAFAACVLGWGIAAGLVVWFGQLTAAGLALVFLLPYAPRALRVLAPAVPALGLAVFAAALAMQPVASS